MTTRTAGGGRMSISDWCHAWGGARLKCDGCTMPGCEHGCHRKPVVERDSRQAAIESETKRGPDRANESDPLATVSTRPKGA